MKKLFWIIFLVVMCLLSFYKIAEAASWTLPGQIKKGDLIVATSTTQAVRLPTSTQGSVLWISSAGMPAWTATSTLGISGGVGLSSLNGQTGSSQTFATNTTATGLNLNITSAANVHTWALSLQSGYGIPLTASTTEWTNFNNTPSTRITAGSGLAWSGNTLSNTMASSTLIAGGTATYSPSVTIATSTDTNLLLQVVCATSTCTFTPQWTGTLAAARLNSNVVQAITNDTNVTGSISAQNLTLGWTGVLAASRGGIGTTTLGDLTVSSSNLSITGGQKVLIGTSTQITLTDNPTFTKGTFTNASTTNLTASGNVYLTGLTSQNCLGTSAAGLLQAGTCTGGSGNSAWTIGNGLIYNATSTDSVLVGTSTPTTATMYLQGSGTKLPLTIASSTGSTLLTVAGSGLLSLYGPGLALDGATGAVYFSSAGGNMYQSWTNGLYMAVNGAYKGVWNQYGLTINNGANVAASGVSLSVMNGNVGIGTTSPRSTTEIYTGAANSAYGLVLSQGGTNSARLFLMSGDATGPALLNFGGSLAFTYGATPGSSSGNIGMVMTNTGNVGIGTTSPGQKLSVASGVIAVYPGAADATSGFALYRQNSITNKSLSITTDASDTAIFDNANSDYYFKVGGSSKLRLSTTGGLSLGNSYVGTDPGAGSMIISGNVGIGTSTPQAVLSVVGSSTFPSLIVASSSNATLFSVTSAAQILACTTCRLTIPQGTAPTLSAAGDIAHDTTNDQLLYGSQPNVLYATSTKSLFLQTPTASESHRTSPALVFDVPITITKVTCRITSEVSNVPSWTFSLPHSTSLGVSTADAMTSGQACTSTTTEQTITTAGDLTLAAGETLWATSSAVSNASTTQINIYFKYDRQ